MFEFQGSNFLKIGYLIYVERDYKLLNKNIMHELKFVNIHLPRADEPNNKKSERLTFLPI